MKHGSILLWCVVSYVLPNHLMDSNMCFNLYPTNLKFKFQIIFEELIRSGFVMYYWTSRQPENGKWLMTCLIKYQNFISPNYSTRKFIWVARCCIKAIQAKKCGQCFGHNLNDNLRYILSELNLTLLFFIWCVT